jgi:hypothetical protein
MVRDLSLWCGRRTYLGLGRRSRIRLIGQEACFQVARDRKLSDTGMATSEKTRRLSSENSRSPRLGTAGMNGLCLCPSSHVHSFGFERCGTTVASGFTKARSLLSCATVLRLIRSRRPDSTARRPHSPRSSHIVTGGTSGIIRNFRSEFSQILNVSSRISSVTKASGLT